MITPKALFGQHFLGTMQQARTRGAFQETRAATFAHALTILIALLACTRAMLAYDPMPGWGLDPYTIAAPAGAFGPREAALMDVLTLLLAGLVLLLAPPSRWKPWAAWASLLMGLGVIGLVHGLPDGPRPSDLSPALAWMAALAGAGGIACGCAHAPTRRAVVALLAGFTAMLVAKGLVQLLIEHPATVAQFEANRAQMLAAQGLEDGGAGARAFERRLRQPEVTGWIGFSNVTASFLAAGGVALAAVAVSPRKAVMAISGVGSFAAIALVIHGSSKGAMVAVAIGLACVAFGRFAPQVWTRGRTRLAFALAGVVVVGPLLALVARGMVGEAVGELSLLFRWFYVEAAARIALEHPLLGVGPGGFKDAYALAKNPISPENAASPHSVVFDAAATMGPAVGLAVLGFLMVIAWRAAGMFFQQSPERGGLLHSAPLDRRAHVVRRGFLGLTQRERTTSHDVGSLELLKCPPAPTDWSLAPSPFQGEGGGEGSSSTQDARKTPHPNPLPADGEREQDGQLAMGQMIPMPRLALLAGPALAVVIGVRFEIDSVGGLTPALAIAWLAGLAGWVTLAWAAWNGPVRGVWLGPAAAALVLIAHGQIEMTPVLVGSSALWAAWLGVALVRVPVVHDGGDPSPAHPRAVASRFVGAVPALMALAVAVLALPGVWAWQGAMARAAEFAQQPASYQMQLRIGGGDPRVVRAVAEDIGRVIGQPVGPGNLARALNILAAQSALSAARSMDKAVQSAPADGATLRAASRAWLVAGTMGHAPGGDRALALARAAAGSRPASAQNHSHLATVLSALDVDGSRTVEVLEALAQAEALNPSSPQLKYRQFEIARRAGLVDWAVRSARGALEADARMRLDPLGAGLGEGERSLLVVYLDSL